MGNHDYEKAWKEIDSLENQGLPKSALEKTEALLEIARRENVPAQIVKALIYRGKYQSQLEEDGLANAIFRLQQEAEQAAFPVKPILHSMLGEMLSSYMDNNYWRFRERTQTASFKPEDIRTWTLEQLTNEASKYHWLAVSDPDQGRGTMGVQIEDFKILLTEGRNDEGLRPTLYDLLAHRAIDFFMNERTYLTQPAYKFYIDDTQAFAKAEDFARWQITSKDTASQKLQTLRLMQQLLAFRLQDRERFSASLLDANLKRLRFVHQNAVLETKDELYLSALQDLQKKYEDSPLVAEVKYEIANFYFTKGSDWQPVPLGSPVAPAGGDDKKWHWKKALDLCNEVIQKYPNSFGAKQCNTLKNSLLDKSLTMQTEVVNLPGEPILARIDYRNTPTVFLKVIRFNEKRRAELDKIRFGNNADDEMLQFFNKLKPVKSWSVKLPDDGDLRQHSVEIKMDKLPLGQYLVMISADKNFSGAGSPSGAGGGVGGVAGYLFTNVSNIGTWQRQNQEEGAEFVVFDRKSGVPLKGVTGELFWQNYNSVFRKYEWKKGGSGTSDADGILRPKASDREGRSYQVLFKLGKDTLFTGEGYYNHTYQRDRRGYQTTHFFTDRAIYRPGQTVFFKGIALQFDEKRMPGILKNQAVTVTFRDANYQEVSKLTLKTNEYGSFSGQFVTPRTGLLGHFQIESSIGGNAHGFRVEEYKRPKFEVTFEPVKGSYSLEESVTMTGKAMAYAGSNVDGARVTWRVVREVRFPWLPWWMMRWFPWRGETMEIANGEAATDAEGKFSFQFRALPDRSIPKEQKPEFSYTVYADVTDITGETQSQEAYLSVGYVSLRADVVPANAAGKPLANGGSGAQKIVPSDPPSGAGGGDGEVNLDSLKKFIVNIENLNGQPEPAQGTLTVELLQAPQTIFLTRFWEKPDRQVMSEKDFKRDFPQLAYAGEDQVENWKVERKVFDIQFDTKTSKEVLLPKVLLPPGKYVVTLRSKDKFGEAVEVKKYYTFYRLTDAGISPQGEQKKVAAGGGEVRPPVPMVGWHLLENQTLEPGETARLYFASSEKSLPILLEIEKDGKQYLRKWITVGALQNVKYLVKEEDRGNLSYHVNFAKNNRSFNQSNTLLIPWSNKDLRIEYGTFRDKLKPGQQEEWVIKIKGSKGEKVAAEMVAGMYDASLDLFAANSWNMNIFPTTWQQVRYSAESYNAAQNQWVGYVYQEPGEGDYRQYQGLNWFNWYFAEGRPVYLMARTMAPEMDMAVEQSAKAAAPPAPGEGGDLNIRGSRKEAGNYYLDGVRVTGDVVAKNGSGNDEEQKSKPATDLDQVKVRSNLNETVFFFPHLTTDAEGNIVIKFTMNEALTRWKFLGLAHTADLKIGTTTKEIVTQKELMVMPNPPRFFRENDEIEFTAKVSNLSDKALSGEARLDLVNGLTGQKMELGSLQVVNSKGNTASFSVPAGQSARLAWRFKVPDIQDVPVIEHTVIATATPPTPQGESFSDAERSAAPVLSNRMLVTETMPMPVKGGQTKTFVFKSMRENKSGTLKHHAVTLEFTQNPAWYAVQALPYLMEYPYECTEQIFARYYANSLATSVANQHPKIKTVFDKWRNYQPAALASNLSKNQELKSALLEETPWVLQAQSEEQQKQNIALLFDLNRMSYEQEAALAKLQERQLPGGGWAWFPGGEDNWYITQYIVEGLGHLQKLGVTDLQKPATWNMVQNAVRYCDARMVEHYEQLEKLVNQGKAKWEDDHLDYLAAHYLYARTFFLEDKSAQASTGRSPSGVGGGGKRKEYISLEGKALTVFDFYVNQAEKHWLNKGIYSEGMLSLALDRTGKADAASRIVKSLKERALTNTELGTYWKYPVGWWWHTAPIETHSLMIEVFSDVANDADAVNELKIWLLKNKQTNHWETTKATSAAVYALLSSGDNWLLDDQPLEIQVGSRSADNYKTWQSSITKQQANAEAGTGYFKVKFEGDQVSREMSTVTVRNPNKVVAWGGTYWQYFEQLDQIKTFEETPLTLKKQLFRVENSATGEVLHPVRAGEKLKVGQKLKARIELRVDRDMEYVHMKDMRASGFEPMNVLSGYKWQGGLGYYESTRDASTNFFFSWLPKGTHVFEYPMRVVHKGDFSNGVTTIQCMYAPEFTSHSEGIRVKVD